ncbi:hypothetical protein V6Z93_006874 [Aspergillus fumigatus]
MATTGIVMVQQQEPLLLPPSCPSLRVPLSLWDANPTETIGTATGPRPPRLCQRRLLMTTTTTTTMITMTTMMTTAPRHRLSLVPRRRLDANRTTTIGTAMGPGRLAALLRA